MVITESWLRAQRAGGHGRELTLSERDIITQAALDYIREQNIVIAVAAEKPLLRDEEGRSYSEKPEHMTHLNGTLLVPKTHRRISFRGKLDTLQAKLIETQVVARSRGPEGLSAQLDEVIGYVREILACEVKASPFRWGTLLGLGPEEIRRESHFPPGGHHPPSWAMGEAAVWLNSARALAREAELAAAKAFAGPEGAVEREDLLLAMNRLSSALHILMCRCRAPREEEDT